ncbi:MAG TPA: transglutaminase domain-containing protein [Chitinophagaceae bacterium]|nr:transglutaminase domain-containing protein [Chitinophagaceae bacterium]
MKWVLYFTVALLLPCFSAAQEYQYADKVGMDAPDSKNTTTKDIADYVNQYCKSDEQKVRAIYVWVISHIAYSKDSIQFIVTDDDHEKLVTTGMRRRRGLCENFAAIFDDICKKTALRSFYIEGYTQQARDIDRVSHAWDAVFINGGWYLFDPTWDAVQERLPAPVNTVYFMIRPGEFIQTHMPFDPMLQFLEHPVTFGEFNKGVFSGSGTYYNYRDSVKKAETDDPYQQYQAAYHRIQQNGPGNELVKAKLQQIRLQLEIIYQDRDSVSYNTAIADYNKAIHLFNDFVTYRNNQFKPAKTTSEVQQMFTDIRKYLLQAQLLLKEVNTSPATLALNTDDVEAAIQKLFTRVQEQEDFYKTNVDDQATK